MGKRQLEQVKALALTDAKVAIATDTSQDECTCMPFRGNVVPVCTLVRALVRNLIVVCALQRDAASTFLNLQYSKLLLLAGHLLCVLYI